MRVICMAILLSTMSRIDVPLYTHFPMAFVLSTMSRINVRLPPVAMYTEC